MDSTWNPHGMWGQGKDLEILDSQSGPNRALSFCLPRTHESLMYFSKTIFTGQAYRTSFTIPAHLTNK